MISIRGTTIRLTRGDTALIQLALTDANGDAYEASDGDEIRFALKRKMTDDYEILLETDIPTDTLLLEIDPADTQDLTYSTKQPYKYDIQITYGTGAVDTFIADSDFYILPEADVYE